MKTLLTTLCLTIAVLFGVTGCNKATTAFHAVDLFGPKISEASNKIFGTTNGFFKISSYNDQMRRIDRLKDPHASLLEWQDLAQQGNVDAQYYLGLKYENEDDSRTAFKWYMFAAKQGHANAQFKIGKMYEYGQGVSQNFKTAMEWHTLAAEQGYNNAKENLSILQKKIAKSKNTSPVVTAKKTLPSSQSLGKKSTLPPCHPEGPIHDCVGARTHPNGAEYVGEYRNNKRHGQGTFYFNTGNKYVGKWKDGKTHGKGIYTYADGRVQKGVWKDGHFQDAQKVTRSAMRNYGREQTPQIVVGK